MKMIIYALCALFAFMPLSIHASESEIKGKEEDFADPSWLYVCKKYPLPLQFLSEKGTCRSKHKKAGLRKEIPWALINLIAEFLASHNRKASTNAYTNLYRVRGLDPRPHALFSSNPYYYPFRLTEQNTTLYFQISGKDGTCYTTTPLPPLRTKTTTDSFHLIYSTLADRKFLYENASSVCFFDKEKKLKVKTLHKGNRIERCPALDNLTNLYYVVTQNALYALSMQSHQAYQAMCRYFEETGFKSAERIYLGVVFKRNNHPFTPADINHVIPFPDRPEMGYRKNDERCLLLPGGWHFVRSTGNNIPNQWVLARTTWQTTDCSDGTRYTLVSIISHNKKRGAYFLFSNTPISSYQSLLYECLYSLPEAYAASYIKTVQTLLIHDLPAQERLKNVCANKRFFHHHTSLQKATTATTVTQVPQKNSSSSTPVITATTLSQPSCTHPLQATQSVYCLSQQAGKDTREAFGSLPPANYTPSDSVSLSPPQMFSQPFSQAMNYYYKTKFCTAKHGFDPTCRAPLYGIDPTYLVPL